MATGTRLYDITSELKELNSVIIAVATSTMPSQGPATRVATLAQLPFVHASCGMWRLHTASRGIMYESTMAPRVSSMTRGYVFCGFSTSLATVAALSHPM